jgi:hypothetical protein
MPMKSISERLDPNSVKAGGNPLNPDPMAGREDTPKAKQSKTPTRSEEGGLYGKEEITSSLNEMAKEGTIRSWDNKGEEWGVRFIDGRAKAFTREGIERFLELRGEPRP